MAFLTGIQLVLLAVLAAAAVDLALTMRRWLALWQQRAEFSGALKKPNDDDHFPGDCHSRLFRQVAAFSLWKNQQGQWVLLTPCGQTGCNCRPGPAKPGTYDGQIVRKECLPAGAR